MFKYKTNKGASDLGLIIFILFIIFLIWLFAGGRSHQSTQGGPFIKPYTDEEAPLQTYRKY